MHVLVGALQILYMGSKKTEIYVNNATLVNVNMYILMVRLIIVIYLMTLHMIYTRFIPDKVTMRCAPTQRTSFYLWCAKVHIVHSHALTTALIRMLIIYVGPVSDVEQCDQESLCNEQTFVCDVSKCTVLSHHFPTHHTQQHPHKINIYS